MSTRVLSERLQAGLAALPRGPLRMALSGGLDSSALLHALAALPEARARGLRAVHVDHGLHAGSRQWAAHCERLAGALDVELDVLRVDARRVPGLGGEASARNARYGAIRGSMQRGEILVLAHHRDDQVETVLLKLMRGAGPEGLGAMRPLRPFASGLAWRPLLDVPREVLHEYALVHRLDWVEDPSNEDPGFDRNYLRHEVMPRLLERWPSAAGAIARSAAHARAAAAYVAEGVDAALPRLRGSDPASLDIPGWLQLPEALRDGVLRQWLRGLDLPGPSHYQAGELQRQLATAAADSRPSARWPGAELRRYRDRLYAMAPLCLPDFDWEAPLTKDPLELPCELGTLELVGADDTDPPPQVRFRRGGEMLRLAGQAMTRELRDLFQEAGIPPWQRGRIPLLLDRQGQLLAVADLWWSTAAEQRFGAAARLVWHRGAGAGVPPPQMAADAGPAIELARFLG